MNKVKYLSSYFIIHCYNINKKDGSHLSLTIPVNLRGL